MTATSSRGGQEGGREVMIEVDQLTRYFGPVPAINKVSFRAYRGEILGFLGPNGAGKTTTMRMLTGYLPPSSGTARIAGHDVVAESMAARREIGYLPESTPLYPEMTIAGYLDFMARLRGVVDRHAAVERVMGRVSIDHRADDLIGHLSKGYRQRVGIAQALVHDPSVIILDEPTIGLDPRQILEVRGLIQELGGDHTVILSTHILPEAQQLCDRVLIIKSGQIVAEDSPEDLMSRVSGGDRLRVTLGGDVAADAVSAALGRLAGVEGVEAQGSGGFEVRLAGGVDPRAEVARTLVEQGWPLLELRHSGASLEDVFLELTRSEEDRPDDAIDDTDDETMMEEAHA